jgi:DNA-binding NarL/FixJ family response regulator
MNRLARYFRDSLPGVDRLVEEAIALSRWVEMRTAPQIGPHPAVASRTSGSWRRTTRWKKDSMPQTMDPTSDTRKSPRSAHEGEAMTTRVLIVDDHAFMRGLIRGLLSPYHDLQIVGEAADGQEAVSAAQTLQPDVILMDVAMPHLNGIEATARIIRFRPRTRVVALSMYMSPQFVMDMAKAGAYGYVVKDYAFEELHPAITAVTSGTPYVSERIAADVAQRFSDAVRSGPTGRQSDPSADRLP